MAGVWKRDGTVAVTNGNKKVTGTGTTFADTKNGVAKGHLFCITSGTSVDFYEVDYVVSNTELYLVQSYRGSTATGKAYEIITTFSDSVPEFARRLTATLSAYQQQSDAFQALLTSTATTVEVTAPDGTKQTLIPWKRVTSEGEGQAARAKTEADKAAASAALAGDIVAASALPLPDVWAPLSDSLRMITGYGREVKVGEDVVARMVNFSRSTTATYIGKDGLLKTAAANEPRFEKKGLLIEGQSTNLIRTSSGKAWENGFSPGANIALIDNADKMTSGIIPKMLKVGNEGRYGIYLPYEQSAPVVVGGTYTLTIRMRRLDANLTAINIYNASNVVNSATIPQGEWGTRTITFTANATDCYMLTSVGQYEYAYLQLEALPFASSYIPTNGAAATRVADRAYILWGQNMPLSVADAVSFAVEATPYKATAPDSRTILDLGVASASIAIDADNTLAEIVIDNKSSRVYFGSNEVTRRIVARYDGSFLTVGNNGVIGTPTAYTADGDRQSTRYMRIGAWSVGDTGWETAQYGTYRCIWGHIRNIRIWHSALTDEQIKAIR